MDRHILLLAATMAMATTAAAQSVLPDTTATLNVRVGYSKSSQNTLPVYRSYTLGVSVKF